MVTVTAARSAARNILSHEVGWGLETSVAVLPIYTVGVSSVNGSWHRSKSLASNRLSSQPPKAEMWLQARGNMPQPRFVPALFPPSSASSEAHSLQPLQSTTCRKSRRQAKKPNTLGGIRMWVLSFGIAYLLNLKTHKALSLAKMVRVIIWVFNILRQW